MDITIPEKLGFLGIPLTSHTKAVNATLLSGKTIRSLTSDEIEKVFSGNVYMDASALSVLDKMDLSHLAGVKENPEILPRKRLECYNKNGRLYAKISVIDVWDIATVFFI